MVHDLLKEDNYTLHSKRHHKSSPQLVAYMECHFLAILRSENNMVEALPHIHNFENV
jgi:hypothetical protein